MQRNSERTLAFSAVKSPSHPPASLVAVTAFIALTGCAGLAVSGQLTPLMLIPGIAIFPGYYRTMRGYMPASKYAIGTLSIAALMLLAADSMIITGDFFLAVAHMTIVFQALKSFDLKEPWDYLQVYFMTLVQLIITSELSYSIVVGAVFVIFLAAFVLAIVMSHFIKAGTLGRVKLLKPAAIIVALSFVFATVLFVAVPRPGSGFGWRKAAKGLKSVGFSDKVDFGSFGEVLEDMTVAMRVELSGKRLPLYFRGATLDNFDGESWSYTIKRKYSILKTEDAFIFRPAMGGEELSVQRIYLEPMDTDVVFGLGEVVRVESVGRFMETNGEGSITMPFKRNRRFVYTAHSVSPEGLRVRNADKYLQLPNEMGKIAGLAGTVTRGTKTGLDRALAIEGHLRSSYSYSLSTEPPPEGKSVVEDFLFKSKKGYCEHFATAMTLMLRTLGTPARVVTGFMGGDVNEYGDYVIVRQKNAHSWVEALIDGKWKRFDPTPLGKPKIPSGLALYMDYLRMGWYRYVVGFSSTDQIRIVGFMLEPFLSGKRDTPTARPSFGLPPGTAYVVIMLAVLTALVWLRRYKRKAIGPESAIYIKFRNGVRKLGGRISESSTSSDVLREARRIGLDGDAEKFIRLYEDARFGGLKMSPDLRKQYQRLSRQPNSPRRGTKTHGV